MVTVTLMGPDLEDRIQRLGTNLELRVQVPLRVKTLDSQLKLLTTANQTPTALRPGNPLLKWLIADPSPDTSRVGNG